MTRYKAIRNLNRLRSGQISYMKKETIEQNRNFYTPEELNEIDEINSFKTNRMNAKNLKLDPLLEKLYNNPTNKHTTIVKRQRQLNGIFKLFNVENLYDLFLQNEPEQIIITIGSTYKYPEDYLNLFNLIFTLNEDLVPDETKQMFKSATYSSKNTTTVNKLIDRFNDRTDYVKMYEELTTQKEHTNDNLKILYSLYTDGIYNNKDELTMVPRGYFYNVRIGKFPETDGNWYDPKTGKLNIVDFKTDKTFSYNYLLPLKVRAIINESLTKYPRKFLIENQQNEPYSQEYFPKLVEKAIGLNTNQYRKVVENYFISKDIDRVKLANAMGHSVDTQLLSYVNNESNQKQLEKNSQSQQ